MIMATNIDRDILRALRSGPKTWDELATLLREQLRQSYSGGTDYWALQQASDIMLARRDISWRRIDPSKPAHSDNRVFCLPADAPFDAEIEAHIMKLWERMQEGKL